MTPEGIRFRRLDNSLTIKEALNVLQATIAAQGEPYARSVYNLDDWDSQGLLSGHMAVERALDILDHHNTLPPLPNRL